jgi:molybdopterin-containing oxidoreductase family iron-sulfur binding subunit
MDSNRHHWRDPEERAAPGPAGPEFPEPLEGQVVQLGRRDFLASAGLAAAAAALAGCSRAPVQEAIPLLVAPEDAVPGRSTWYATTCGGCSAGCGALSRVRDGRPIKLEGNPEHPASRGGLCAVGQASLLDLYDSRRLRGPMARGREATWKDVDAAVVQQLAGIRARSGAVRLLAGTITSPTLRAHADAFLARFPGSRLVTFDALSSSAIPAAHEATHGVRALPRYRFDRAEVIVSFDADFLGTWISPVEYAAGWRAGRPAEPLPVRRSFHAQIEPRLSLTGSKADRRFRLGPGELDLALAHLALRIARRAGAAVVPERLEPAPLPGTELDELAERLWRARGRSLVLSGSQSAEAQTLANLANHLLGNYGATLDLERPSRQRQGNDADLEDLLRELAEGRVAALLVHGANPVHELPAGDRLADALRRVPLVVSFAARLDETARLAHYVCPDHHFLESWGDAEAVAGLVSLTQPSLHPLFGTRSALESLAAWSGDARPAYELLRESWRTRIFPRQAREASHAAFWDRSLRDGFALVEPAPERAARFRPSAVRWVAQASRPGPGEFSLALYPKVAILEGSHAGNPWLQELPDPISKVTWDNYACLSPAAAGRIGVKQGDVVRIELGEGEGKRTLELPAHLQPGQHDGTVAVALGYGGVVTERFSRTGKRWLWGRADAGPDGRVGRNAAPFLDLAAGALQYARPGVRLVPTGRRSPLACTQTHHTVRAPQDLPLVGGQARDLVREVSLAQAAGQGAAAPAPERLAPREELWPEDHRYTGQRWHMVVDLDACTGCSACIVSCQAENNVPTVGKDEVLRRREMHWLRIDRYYAGGDDVEVVHQPLLCQQCDRAPCETVCPVLATVHSSDGLNQQVYNRCVGTRYCANNCPYKVRRFNWFDYGSGDRVQDLALNPDVTVRSRGVMEKCTFCVQRIHAARIEARSQGRPLADGEIQTACQQSCPAQAIAFGDLNDPRSRVARLASSRRSYALLEELDLRPAVDYLAVVRDRPAGGGEGKGRHG